MDYGHPLQFGTFITPTATPPDAAVARAQLSEELGYDLVTFQDHPYQPGFLDTWTLMTWVAAQTRSVHISANVLNLPLRPPAVTARAAASLDLLSGGRFNLGLGAGGFWDAIEAMGGRRLTPGQSVDALDEAIDVIRGIWAADEPGILKHDGDHYRVHGAKRGPLPAHDIPIWLGAYKPRMLRLVGRKADGWLPSLPYLKPGDLAAGQAVIDEAAREAGRDPREIRRLLNISGTFSASRRGFLDGPSTQWVEELLPLVLRDGIGTFIVMADDPDVTRRFAEEVAPALRAAVARERGPQTTTAVRGAAALARRRAGIDYDAVPASLAAATVEPGDFGYARVRSSAMRAGSPGLVLQPRNPAEVVDALAFAREQPVPLSVRSGGHGIGGRSTNDGGIVIDLAKLDAIEVVDRETRRVRIEPGARWGDVATALAPYGWALTSGDYGGVGVGGLATSGGIGWLVRQHGLTIDHLLAVDLVLADGTRVRASADENPDLFWGVRGAGANLGIVTSFEFVVDEVGDVGFGQFALDASDTAGLLDRFGKVLEAAPRDTTANLIMSGARRGRPPVAQIMAVVDSADPDTVVERLQPIVEIAPVLDQAAQIVPYAALMHHVEGSHQGQGEPVSRSGLLDHLTPEFTTAAAHLVASGAVYFFQIRAMGGAVADVDPDATAFAHRSANFQVVAFGTDRRRIDRLWDDLAGHFSGLYINFETDLRPERIADAFPPATLRRLRDLKRRYDPGNLFRDNFNVA
ncbi:LLM class flavin-dependent oxidoreductase [Polymorphospora rubra]|uniref:LLM class flavin-dependent oxidoreductase n=1 Tax=Polymorphospora rubra TaxID=338584 RepID=UPI0033C47C1B